MKKLLLAMLMVVALTCIFAMAVSAAEIPEWGEITTVDGMADKSVFGADGTVGATSRVLMSDGVTYPAYYIFKNSNSLSITFTDINKATGKNYAAVNVIRLEVPSGMVSAPQAALKTANGYTSLLTVSLPEGFTTLNSYTFYGSSTAPSALVKVDLPSTLKTVGQKEFLDCAALEELILPNGIETIPTEFAKNTTALKRVVLPASLKTIENSAFAYSGVSGEIVIPEGCTTINQYAFAYTSVEKVVVPSTLESVGSCIFRECHSLTTVHANCPTIGEQMFYRCENVTTVVLKNTVTIGKQAFNNDIGDKTTKIVGLVLPEGLTTMKDYAFTRCDITEIVLPKSLVTLGQSVFNGCTKLEKVVVLGSVIGVSMFQNCSSLNTLVVTENISAMGKQCFGSASSKFTTFYTGTDYAAVRDLGVATGSDRFSTSKTAYCTYEDYISGNYTAKTCLFVYDANLCDAAFGGVHTEPNDDGDCTTALVCSMCAEHTFKEALEHQMGEKLIYTSFTEKGEYYSGCINDGCTCGEAVEKDALFICLGYSVSEFGATEIAIGYMASSECITLYEAVMGKDVTFGVFAVSQNKLGDNDIFGENGASAGVISYDTSVSEFSVFELRLYGFEGAQKDAKIAIGAYVCVADEDICEYSYIQEGTANQGEKYYFASFNEMLNA